MGTNLERFDIYDRILGSNDVCGKGVRFPQGGVALSFYAGSGIASFRDIEAATEKHKGCCQFGPLIEVVDSDSKITYGLDYGFQHLPARTKDRRFNLVRTDDLTGMSGTGVVASGIRWGDDGRVAMRWHPPNPSITARSTGFYDSIEELIEIHGHDGRATIDWIDPLIPEGVLTFTGDLSDADVAELRRQWTEHQPPIVLPRPPHALSPQESRLVNAIQHTVEYVGLDVLKPIGGWSWYDAWKSVDPIGLEHWLDEMPSSAGGRRQLKLSPNEELIAEARREGERLPLRPVPQRDLEDSAPWWWYLACAALIVGVFLVCYWIAQAK